MKYKILITIWLLLFLLTVQSSCKKFVQIPPPSTSLSGVAAYSADATAIAVLTGIYANISSSLVQTTGSIPSLTLFTGLSGDEFTLWSGLTNYQATAYYTNALTGATNGNYGAEFWSGLYSGVFSCNSAIDGLNASSGLTPGVKQQLLGEAKFMRAFFYFYLVNLYGDVPLALTSNYKVNSVLARTPTTEVFQQIIADLHDAQKLLSPSYLDATLQKITSDRVRPTTWAATAFLARSYLYSGNWGGADSAATILINNSSMFGLSSLDTVFLMASLNNNEAIFQLPPVTFIPSNTDDALAFIVPDTGPGTAYNYGVYLSPNLLGSFEPGDNRMIDWVGNTTIGTDTFYYPYKYKINSTATGTEVSEFFTLLRLGEQYLIRAEARANEGNVRGAQSDLDTIRARAGLGATAASTQADLLAAILHERQVEMFAELGQRWLDLKRTKTIDATMTTVTPQKGGGMWFSYQQLYPISAADIESDPNLKQNSGY
jgi:hypothetical protein